jgi:hypothetical protein
MPLSLAEPAVDALEGLHGLLERFAAQRGDALGVLPGLTTFAGPGWIPSTELVREPYELLDRLIDDAADRRNVPRHVAAALLWKAYAYWHTVPMALGWALNRRVPIMRFEDTVVKVAGAGLTIGATSVRTAVLPGDPLAGAPGTIVVADPGAAIRAALLAGQSPVIKAIGRLTRVGERNLWGSTAEALAHPLTACAGFLPPADARELLAAVGRPVDGLLGFSGDGYRRRTCCLWITLPGTKPCATCCVSSCGQNNT